MAVRYIGHHHEKQKGLATVRQNATKGGDSRMGMGGEWGVAHG